MKNEIQKVDRHTEVEKRQAAYALNMCTVSVSQIVDYNDVYIMEQEYEAILNNLNLKQMPKDEALLRILSEIMNTITFFRIQDIRKKQIEKKYESRMKNAIWSAVPSLNVVVSANPAAIALALVTQIGSGYMNYRKEKASAGSDKEDAEIELEITAIEQLNSLKRELFTTAWRLADEYDFEDEWRLTEKQIKQYNDILIDCDELRKYERLDAIKDNFSAYPPFWYFIGNAANSIAKSQELDLTAETRQEFKRIALSHFEKYEEVSENSILRQDQLNSSCALEHAELLLEDKEYDRSKVIKLITKAAKMSGNAFDILQVCAIAYLKVNDLEDASKLLRILVNEDYNKTVNAQLLSGIYVREKKLVDYNILSTRVAHQYLYPMPLSGEDEATLETNFQKQQKMVLKGKFKKVLEKTIDKYSTELYREISVFDLEDDYSEDFFENNKRAKKVRMMAAKRMFVDESKREYYLERMSTINLPVEYVGIFEEMFGTLFQMSTYSDPVLQGEALDKTSSAIVTYRDAINSIQDGIKNQSFSLKDYERIQRVGIYHFVKDAFNVLYHQTCKMIDNAEMDGLLAMEGDLMTYCDKIGVAMPEISMSGGCDNRDFDEPKELFDVSLFGAKAISARRDLDYVNNMLSFIKDKMAEVNSGDDLQIFYKGDKEYERYFNDVAFEMYPSLKPNSLMVIKDNGKTKIDLIYTTEGVVYVQKGKVKKKTPYADVIFAKDSLVLFGTKYKSNSINVAVLYDIVKGIDKKFINDLEQKIEYVGKIDAKSLNEWFKDKPEAMEDGVTRVYAWPNKELLNGLGYCLQEDLDKEMYLLQFYYDNESNDIIGIRIVEFDWIEPSFKSKLDSAGGVIRVEKGR